MTRWTILLILTAALGSTVVCGYIAINPDSVPKMLGQNKTSKIDSLKWFSYKGDGDSIKIGLQVCFLDTTNIMFKLHAECCRKDSFDINLCDTAHFKGKLALLTSEKEVLILNCFNFQNDSTGITIRIEEKQNMISYVDGYYGINRDPNRMPTFDGNSNMSDVKHYPRYFLFRGKPPQLELVK